LLEKAGLVDHEHRIVIRQMLDDPITGAMKRPEPKRRALLTGINAHLQPRHKMKTRCRTQQRSE
jgi:hypothetical protein